MNYPSSKYFYHRLTVILLILFLCSPVTYSQIQFSFEDLRKTYNLIPSSIKNEINQLNISKPEQYLFQVNLSGININIKVRTNNYNEIDHVGINLINKSGANSILEVYDFIERELLISKILQDKFPFFHASQTNGNIEIFLNGKQLNDSYIREDPLKIDTDTPFRLRYNSEFFLIEWALETSEKFILKIPNDYPFITGKTKDELEKDLIRKILSIKETKINFIKPFLNELQPYNKRLYVKSGEIYLTVPELSSDKFFMIKDSIYPVFNSQFYKESIRNLFLNTMPSTHVLEINQKLYGGNEEKYRVNINKFYSNFLYDYNIYFGFQNVDKENIVATVLISHQIYNFKHLLEIRSTTNSIFKKNSDIQGLFFAYIPKEIISP